MFTVNVELLKSTIESLVNQRDESRTKVFVNSGVGKDFFSNLNKGQIPSIEKIASLAEYLGVSIDYLLGRENNAIQKNADNRVKGTNNGNMGYNIHIEHQNDEITNELVTVFNNLSFSDKAKVMSLIAELSEKNEK